MYTLKIYINQILYILHTKYKVFLAIVFFFFLSMSFYFNKSKEGMSKFGTNV